MRIKWRSLAGPLLAFALAAGMILAAPGLSGAARAVDLDTQCSLTISPGSLEFEDLAEANVVIDLYKVADAVPVDALSYLDNHNKKK